MRPSDWGLALSVVVAAMFATLVGLALTYQAEARLVPLVVGIPSLLMALWQVFRSASSESPRKERGHRVALVWLSVFTAIVLLGGLLAGGTIAVVVSQRYWLKESWRAALGGGAVAVFLLYVCFGLGFGFELFPGLIAQWTTY